MKQLPESVKPNMSKSIWKVIIPIMFGSVVFVVIRFFIYCPNAKDTGIIAVMACIMHGLCSAITTIVLPVLNRLDSQKQTKI